MGRSGQPNEIYLVRDRNYAPVLPLSEQPSMRPLETLAWFIVPSLVSFHMLFQPDFFAMLERSFTTEISLQNQSSVYLFVHNKQCFEYENLDGAAVIHDHAPFSLWQEETANFRDLFIREHRWIFETFKARCISTFFHNILL